MNKLKALLPSRDEFLLCAATGLLSALGFPKWNLWPCAWFFLVPLLHVMRESNARQGFKLALWSGIVGNFLQLYWITWTISDYTAVPVAAAAVVTLLLSLLVSLFWGAWGASLCWLRARSRVPLPVLAAALWVIFEWLRTPLIRFNWNKLGVLWLSHDNLVQAADLFGVYGLSFFVVLANAAVYEIFALRWRRRQGEEVSTDEARARAAIPTIALLLIGAVFLYGYARRAGMESKMNTGEPLLRAALIQGNIEQRMKWDPAWEEEILKTYEELTRQAVAEAKQSGELDLVVWPEAAVPFFPTDESAPGWRLHRLVNETGVPILFGAPHYEARHYYNSAFLMRPGTEELAHYDKNVLVPLGEYVPLTGLFFFVDKITEVGGSDFTPGTGARALELGNVRIGTLICYEGIFPGLVRDFERGGTDVFANITNDAWFGNTSAPWQHMATVRMRAIETRSFVLRAANTGITTLIDPLGVAREPTELNERTYRIVSAGEDLSDTFYEKHGDVVVGLSTLGMLLALGFALMRREEIPPTAPPEDQEEA